MQQNLILPQVQQFIEQRVNNLTAKLVRRPNIDEKKLEEAIQINIESQMKEKESIGLSSIKKGKGMKYRTYSSAFKKKAVADVVAKMSETTQSLSKVIKAHSKKLGIHPKNLQRWHHAISVEKIDCRRKPAFPQMEEKLMQFVGKNPKIKRRHIIAHSKKIMKEILPENYDKFNFSKGWYERFRNRYSRKLKMNQVEGNGEEKAQTLMHESERDLAGEKLKIQSGQVKVQPKYQRASGFSVQQKQVNDKKNQIIANKNVKPEPLSNIDIPQNREQQL